MPAGALALSTPASRAVGVPSAWAASSLTSWCRYPTRPDERTAAGSAPWRLSSSMLLRMSSPFHHGQHSGRLLKVILTGADSICSGIHGCPSASHPPPSSPCSSALPLSLFTNPSWRTADRADRVRYRHRFLSSAARPDPAAARGRGLAQPVGQPCWRRAGINIHLIQAPPVQAGRRSDRREMSSPCATPAAMFPRAEHGGRFCRCPATCVPPRPSP